MSNLLATYANLLALVSSDYDGQNLPINQREQPNNDSVNNLNNVRSSELTYVSHRAVHENHELLSYSRRDSNLFEFMQYCSANFPLYSENTISNQSTALFNKLLFKSSVDALQGCHPYTAKLVSNAQMSFFMLENLTAIYLLKFQRAKLNAPRESYIDDRDIPRLCLTRETDAQLQANFVIDLLMEKLVHLPNNATLLSKKPPVQEIEVTVTDNANLPVFKLNAWVGNQWDDLELFNVAARSCRPSSPVNNNLDLPAISRSRNSIQIEVKLTEILDLYQANAPDNRCRFMTPGSMHSVLTYDRKYINYVDPGFFGTDNQWAGLAIYTPSPNLNFGSMPMDCQDIVTFTSKGFYDAIYNCFKVIQ